LRIVNEQLETKVFFESPDVFRTLFERSPNAILLADIHNPTEWLIVQCNEASWRMHGYDQKDEILRQPLTLLITKHQDLASIINDAHQKGTTTRDEIHRKRDGSEFQVQSVYTLVQLKGTEYMTIFVQDVTDMKRVKEAEEKFQAIFENSPDGIVIIVPSESMEETWPWLIEDCNKEFCEMNGYDRKELIGKDIRTVSYETSFDEGSQENTFEKLEKWPVKGDDVLRLQYYQKIKQGRIRKKEAHRRKDGTTFIIEASSRLVSLGGKEYVLGIDRDITKEEHLRRFLEDLQIDVGRTFHAFSSTLFQMRLALTPTIQALGPDPFRNGFAPTADETWQAVVGLWNNLVTSLKKLVDEMKSDSRRDLFPESDWSTLDNLLSLLTELDKIDKVEYRIPVLQRAARQIIDSIDKIQQQHAIRRDLLREVKFNAEQLERMACLIILKRVQDRIIEAHFLVRDIRQRVLTDSKTEEKTEICEFWRLVTDAQKGLAEYATYKGVTFKENNRSNGARVKVVRTHIVRALNNLLDNAIKYSWWRDANVRPWIDINCYLKEDRVYVEIEDYGVPIPQSEIDQGLIFQLGYRGRLSGQRDRPGTGIGLFDSRAMARRYGGDLVISSHPATPPIKPSDKLKVPHLKTATLYLPISKL